MPTLSTLYGAILAGVDVVIMGAGIPYQIPSILDRLCRHEQASYRLDVHGAAPEEELFISLDPEEIFPGISAREPQLMRPSFLPIVSSTVLAKTLLRRTGGKIDGFVVEAPSAGGHNAPPRGPLRLDSTGEPIYGPKDYVDASAMAGLDVGYLPDNRVHKRSAGAPAVLDGARGIQVGTAFAFCRESGMDTDLRRHVLDAVVVDQVRVHTNPVASPTSYPFKVAQIPATLSDPEVYSKRKRLCDIGMLRQAYRLEDGTLCWRCPAEPIPVLCSKGGSAEEAEGSVCLCNALAAAAGIPQTRTKGYTEAAIVTSGDNLSLIERYLPDGAADYSAEDVLNYLLQAETGVFRLAAHRQRQHELRRLPRRIEALNQGSRG